MQKKTADKIIDAMCIIGVVSFIILGIVAILTKNVEFIYDRFFSAAIFLFAYLIHRKIHLKMYSFLLIAAVLIFHHLKLYDYIFFNFIGFDKAMHFSAGFVLALIFYDYLMHEFRGSRAKAAVFALLAAIGLTASNEIIEYFGAYFFGSGQGLLYYGAGDFGAYADTAWDLICNTLGAFTCIVLAVILGRAFHKNKKKKIR